MTSIDPDFGHCALILDALSDPAMLVGVDRRILLVNVAARELFQAPMQGLSVASFLRQPESLSALDKGLEALQSGLEIPQPVEARMFLASGGRETTLRVQVAALKQMAGPAALLVTLRDVSQQEDAEQQRRDFVANVSHELRSPLTALTGFIETLKGPARNDPAAQEQFLDIMEREAHRMSRLVGDLLSLSRVESAERVRPRDQVSLSDVIQATLAALRPKTEKHGVQVTVSGDGAMSPVPGDRDQLMQVFHNLIENAVKYGGAGGRVDIICEQLDSMPGLIGPVQRVTVRDFGDGINPIHLPRLTERFYRVDGHRSRALGGTGLGLAIVKHIINRHRGRFVIQSTLGEGSSFTVKLPVL